MCKGAPDDLSMEHKQTKQTVIWRGGEYVCIRILRRKTKPKGSGVIRRRCSCEGGVDTCAVHTLWDRFFAHLPNGHQPWQLITAGSAREKLRAVLSRLGVAEPHKYGTHDLRRGHAEVCATHVTRCARERAHACMQGHAAVRVHARRDPQSWSVAQLGVHDVFERSRARRGAAACALRAMRVPTHCDNIVYRIWRSR